MLKGKGSVTKKSSSYCMIPFTWSVWNRQIHRDRKYISGCQVLRAEEIGWECNWTDPAAGCLLLRTLTSRDRGWGKGKRFIFRCWPPGRWETCLKAHHHISVQAEVFIRSQRERTKRSRQGLEKFWCRWTQAILIVRGWSGVPHPGSVVGGQQISQSWDAWRSRSVSFGVSS